MDQPYHPPGIERVLTAEDVAREVLYAGGLGTPVDEDDE
jgi:hypothetical protein